MDMLSYGSHVGIVCCSNGQVDSYKEKIEILLQTLRELGLIPVCSEYIYEKYSVFCGTGKERAQALMDFFLDSSIKAIFDISGGDLANGVLEYLDFEVIKRNYKPFFGYSDLTTIINAIYAQTGKCSYLYQVRNLIYRNRESQIHDFTESVLHNGDELYHIDYRFIQGQGMKGVVVGGNIRCFLKLAGTPYMPCMSDKILFLESFGGEVAQITTYLHQLRQMNIFQQIKGILLGTFTTLDGKSDMPSVEELIKYIVSNPDLPIARTRNIGHGSDSKCIVIGKEIVLRNTCSRSFAKHSSELVLIK
jgi:muramoyltetrapeptide carboxypeptidase LdcA involved in peptidoglycan recycling